MTPAAMARIDAAAFPRDRAWPEAEIAALLGTGGVAAITGQDGFALVRVLPPEAELLTIAVDPAVQGQGHGTALLADVLHHAAQSGVEVLFLEVASDNAAARALYERAGFAQVGQRKGYYRRSDGTRSDALILSRDPAG
jgi:ribosomal-protein-alanine N-acetyltransferase